MGIMSWPEFPPWAAEPRSAGGACGLAPAERRHMAARGWWHFWGQSARETGGSRRTETDGGQHRKWPHHRNIGAHEGRIGTERDDGGKA